MVMTENEILREYQAAKNKKGQVTILADMNMCKPEDIVKILVTSGVSEDDLPKKRTRKQQNKTEKTKESLETNVADPLQVMMESLTTISEQRQEKIKREQMILEHIMVAYASLMEANTLMKGENNYYDSNKESRKNP